ncbi:hypothetical protein HYX12_00275 [Candidatus Woesearchaeota archaeon]|nr:hypothetical protein [Candidatus Woesearchaeota archaeon]
MLSLVENKKTNTAELEVILASLFFYLWSQFLFFKKTLIETGAQFIWMNIPSQIVSSYFPTFSVAEALVMISIVPLLTGIYVIYKSLFHLKNTRSFLIISLAISTIFFTAMRLISFELAMAFIGVILAILFSTFYQEVSGYLQKTKLNSKKLSFFKIILPISSLVLLLATMAYPAINTSLQQNTPSDEEIDAFLWLDQHTLKKSGVLALVEEGHLITYYGKRSNLMDDQFGLIEDVDQRYRDQNSLFATHFQTQAIDLLNKYEINYLLLSSQAKEKYDMVRFNYLSPKCFRLVHHNGAKIYELRCQIERK